MSDSQSAGSLSRDSPQSDDRTIGNDRRSTTSRNASRRPPQRARPQSWHPYGPVEPPLEALSSRSIGVHSILNPPSQTTKQLAASFQHESLSQSSSPRLHGTSPTSRSSRPLASQPLSPRSHARQLTNPSSPSARFVGGGGRTSGQSSVAQSPLVHQEHLMGPRLPSSSASLPLEAGLRPVVSLTGTQPPAPVSLHSTPSLHSRRTSAGPGPPLTNPNSQETSPNAPQSTLSPFGRVSPAAASVSIPRSTVLYPTVQSAYTNMEPTNRGEPAAKGSRSQEEGQTQTGPPQGSSFPPGMIPCVLDMRSGSSSQAEKRKANSDASRRFRNRKRNEMQLEQRLTAQQDEITRSVELVRRQSEEIRALIQQRDYYRSERNYFREHVDRTISLSALPPRPSSPRYVPSDLLTSEGGTSAWSGADAARSVSGTQPTSGTLQGRLDPVQSQPQQPCWSANPSYSTAPIQPAAQGAVTPAVSPSPSGGPLPPLQGSWPRP